MRVPVSWLSEYVEIPPGTSVEELDAAFVRMGLEVEEIHDLSRSVTGPLVVGRVREFTELTGFKKPIRYCQVEVGPSEVRGIICGATNFAAGDIVVVALPGTVLPGGFAISARKTYGHISDGMLCSARELGLGDDHSGILVLPPSAASHIGQDARPVIGLDEVIFELNINPDRGYALSIRGVARDLALALGTKFTDPAAITATPGTAQPAYPVSILDTVGCDRFAARAVRGISPNTQSPQWMQRRLIHAGMRPISLPVDITNYLMLELGQPMHVFDLDRLRGPLMVRRAQAGERLRTLDGVDRELDPEDMVICDDTGPVSLAAVMGGESTEVSAATVNVLFEAAHWDPIMVTRTCRRHKLSSEASRRWERGVDSDLALVALERAIDLLTTYAGGTPSTEVLDLDYRSAPPTISLRADLPSRLVGLPYTAADVTRLLRAIGCTVVEGEPLQVTPPRWRPDLTDPADLVEEVVRLDGYDKVASELPIVPPGRGLTPEQRRRRMVNRALAEAGYVEVLSYPFVSEAAYDALGLPEDDPRRQALRVANPLSEQEPYLRTTLLPPLLATLARNLGRGQRDLALFEMGKVFLPAARTGTPPVLPVEHRPDDADLAVAAEYLPRQPLHVAVVLTGERDPSGWWGPGRPADWADAVDAARIVASAARVSLTVRQATQAPWHPGRCAALWVGEQIVGYAGELHPAVCSALNLPARTCAMELNLDALPPASTAVAPPLSTYPPALIDVAVVVSEEVPAAEVQQALSEGAGELLEEIRLFDVYSGPQLGEGRKSLAYKLVFRAPDRTLTVDEAVAARDAAVAVAAERFGAVLRGA
mgnify:CR=1 FL=1